MFQHHATPLSWIATLKFGRVATLRAMGFMALATLTLFGAEAGARRHYFRQRYAPPASAMVLDLYSGRILYSKNANDPRYPASLTKVMTLYLLFDALRDGKIGMTSRLRVSAHAVAQSPTKLDLSEGDTISVADAIGAIVTKSANDMAVAVAEALSGSEEEFARRMTQKARTIGMLNTTFRNASGLPNEEQKTTAQDLIILGKSILADHPERCKVFATKYFQYDGEVYRNHNTLLFTYEGMEGMKTGFTSASGFNLIATARRNDKRLLAVVLGGASGGARNAAMRSILDNAWPKALTQMASRKAGLQFAAAAKPKPAPEEPPPPRPKPAKVRAEDTPMHAFPAPAREAAKPIAIVMPDTFSRLKRRPDRISISMLMTSIEAELAKGSKPRGGAPAQASSDATTDEPDDRAEREASRNPSFAPPPQEIARNETLVSLTATPPASNMSVHYKTLRPVEVVPLDAVALDGGPPAEPAKPLLADAASPPRREPIAVQIHEEAPVVPALRQEDPAPTLASATAAEALSMDQPGPFHVQVGAFTDREQARERLESVKEALGVAATRAHPVFIMPVSMPSGATMYRARLSRFPDEAQAKAACKRLKRSGIDCWDIRAQ